MSINNSLAEKIQDAFHLDLEVTDPETVAELRRHVEAGDYEEYALAALRLGVLALRTARGEIDTGAIKREGERIVDGVRAVMTQHSEGMQANLGKTLGEYFNPSGGKFSERVDRLVKRDGELENIIADKLTGKDSQLVRRLGELVGEDSPLWAKLDPEAKDGVVAHLVEMVDESLTSHRKRIVDQFSLDESDSALSRMLAKLTSKNGELRKDLTESIDEVVKEFSLDNDDSALSRMKRMVETTNKQIQSNLTLDEKDSALYRLRGEIVDLLEKQQKKQSEFETAVIKELTALSAKKKESERSTTHGLEFEDAVGQVLHDEAARLADICEATGATTGTIKNCKKGDFVMTLGAEAAMAGAKIVVEAKQSAAYKLKDALDEMDEARRNRAAGVGLFVFSARSESEGLDPITRHGNDVVVIWDRDAATGDLILRLGYSLARALVARAGQETPEQADIDFEQLDRSVASVAKEVERLDTIDGHADSIAKGSEKIRDQVRVGKKTLRREVARLEEQLDAIKESM
jgi:hypothetical protein